MNKNERRRAEVAAKRYAEANKSDPFAYRRAMSHLNNGVAGIRVNEAHEREDAFYDAKLTTINAKLPAGQEFSDGSNVYEVQVATDMKVP